MTNGSYNDRLNLSAHNTTFQQSGHVFLLDTDSQDIFLHANRDMRSNWCRVTIVFDRHMKWLLKAYISAFYLQQIGNFATYQNDIHSLKLLIDLRDFLTIHHGLSFLKCKYVIEGYLQTLEPKGICIFCTLIYGHNYLLTRLLLHNRKVPVLISM